MEVTIYHNPACSTSRKVLAALRERGVELTVVEYLNTPPSRTMLKGLLAQMGLSPRDILRRSGTPYDQLGLGDASLSDDALLDAIEAHPILIQRPIVVTPDGARLCRPVERLDEIVPS